jgi:hypothetical protein
LRFVLRSAVIERCMVRVRSETRKQRDAIVQVLIAS